jgi:hypothetical protein
VAHGVVGELSDHTELQRHADCGLEIDHAVGWQRAASVTFKARPAANTRSRLEPLTVEHAGMKPCLSRSTASPSSLHDTTSNGFGGDA